MKMLHKPAGDDWKHTGDMSIKKTQLLRTRPKEVLDQKSKIRDD